MRGYPLSGFGSRPVGDPPLDPSEGNPGASEATWACTSCGAPIYRGSDGSVGHVRGTQGVAVLADKCTGATA